MYIMASTSNISVLLKFFAKKQNSPFVLFSDFCDYIKRYAQHNIEEVPELVVYLGNPEQAVEKELSRLSASHQISILDQDTAKKIIFVAGYFNAKFADRYKEIQVNAAIPFPTTADLPKNTPFEILNKQNCQDIIFKLMEKQDKGDQQLYSISIPNNVPSVLFPGNVPVKFLIDAVMEKIRRMLKKEEYHDYYLKKLRISNPGKELSSKNFFSAFLMKPELALSSLQSSGDSFYFWNQLCYFIKQDYEKVKDFTQEDINVLQSVYIAEIVILFYKNVAQKNLQRESALKTLKVSMTKPPYYFTMDTILKFTDSKGIPLYGQFNDEDLKEFLQKETTESKNNELPELLVLKTENGTRYFVYKNNVIPLILRLASDAHTSISDKLTKDWFRKLRNFDKIPEMNSEQAFNGRLEEELKTDSPMLYALLTANFLPVLNAELQDNSSGSVQESIFTDGELMSYAGIIQLNRNEIYENAKILLPIWYTIPVVSWIIALFVKKPSKSKKKKAKKNVSADKKESGAQEAEAENGENADKKQKRPMTKKDALVKAAEKIEASLVPHDSTIEKELVNYRKLWNKMITEQARSNLTEDVNALIRDYMRKVLRTISTKTFTAERIQELAESLVNTPNMSKITEHDAILAYTQLYMIYLVKNM